jgi:hypothetical protein
MRKESVSRDWSNRPRLSRCAIAETLAGIAVRKSGGFVSYDRRGAALIDGVREATRSAATLTALRTVASRAAGAAAYTGIDVTDGATLGVKSTTSAGWATFSRHARNAIASWAASPTGTAIRPAFGESRPGGYRH